MPKWIHDRAKHIRKKNPGMAESTSFAIATQQAYAAGKAPKKFGTTEGKRAAKQKYDGPKSKYSKTADPKSKSKTSSISLDQFLGFSDELKKIAAQVNAVSSSTSSRATGTSQVTKPVSSTSQPKLPKLVSKPQAPAEFAPPQDHIRSMKANPPPPVTL